MKLDDIKVIGVLGGGLMGSAITQSIIVSGYKGICRDLTEDILKNTRSIIIDSRFGMRVGVERGKLTKEQMEKALANLTLTTKVEDLKNCDIIIESIGTSDDPTKLEDKGVKMKVFAELDKLVKKEAIFASNTSSFTIADMAKAVQRKDRFIGMHFFRPANILKAVELTYTPDNSEEIIQIMEGFCKRMGKIPVRVKDVPGDTGFIGNRLFGVARREAQKMVDAGIATTQDIDTVMKEGYGWTLGIFDMTSQTRDPRQKSGQSR
ncbi:MAG: 3-hydroxyacyl-CoA dehydrogenase family protein [Dehalococcoidales bacterium]|nr:3-hydroxyacyl-CoA dehydrogenase family protein [Dehalococcoidales bacterium]